MPTQIRAQAGVQREPETPLEQLVKANEEIGRTRRRRPRKRDPARELDRWYRKQLRRIVREIADAVEAEVLPVVRETKAEYTLDADPVATRDGWADRVIQAINLVWQSFTGAAFEQQADRLARQTVSMAESESTNAFLKSVNEAVGVDMSPMLDREGMREYLDVAAHNNAELIKSVPQDYLKGVEEAVMGGIRAGEAPTTIARNIQHQTGINQRRARFIARDQTAKLTGEITERRQKQAGIKYFRWSTSGDSRVGDDHRAAARRDVGYGPGIYRWDQPPKEGIPGRATRPNCRCTAIPVFEWEISGR